MSVGETILLSVVVATRNNRKKLQRLLETLENQYMSAYMYEVVVVDAQSDDDTFELMRDYEPRYRLNYFPSRREGLSAARNHGAEEAYGDHLLFLPDDCLAPPTCLQAHLEAHKAHQHRVVRGPVVPLESEEIPMLDHPPPSVKLSFNVQNASMSKMALLKVGGFHEEEDPVIEDREIGWRLAREQWTEHYTTQAYAYHHRPASEGGAIADLKEQAWLSARSAVAHYSKHPDSGVAMATGIHPLARVLANLTSGDTIYDVARALREGRLGEIHWIRSALDRRIYLNYYHRALQRELADQELD